MKVKELAKRHSVTSVILEVRKEIRTEEREREKRQGNKKRKKKIQVGKCWCEKAFKVTLHWYLQR